MTRQPSPEIAEAVTKFDVSCGCRECRLANAVEAERLRLRAAVLAFAENRMHRPWLKELAAIFDGVTPHV